MHKSIAFDVGIDDEKEETMTTEEHMESLLYQFIKLYERWAEDRQVAAKQGSDVAKLIKDFSNEVTRFESLDDALREKIKECIHTEAKNMAIYMGKTVADAAGKDTELIAKQLRKSVSEANDTLSQYRSETYQSKWLVIGMTVLTSILTSLMIVWFFMPTPAIPLTSQQIRYLVTGETFNEIWPKLSKEEKARFIKLSEKNGMVLHN